MNKPQESPPSREGRRRRSGMSLSMHDGIGVWCDCCSCEAEERWAALAEEMGIDLSDYEEDTDEGETEE